VVKSPGMVRPRSGVSTLTAKVSGKIIESNFENGDFIKLGESIMFLEEQSLAIQKDSNQTELEKSRYDMLMTQKFIESINENTNKFSIESEGDYYQEYLKYQMETTKISESISGYLKKISDTKNKIDGYETLLESMKSGENKFNLDSEYKLNFLDYKYKLEELTNQNNQRENTYNSLKTLHKSGSVSNKALNDAKRDYETTKNTLDKFKNESLLNTQTVLDNYKNNLYDYKMELNRLTPESQTLSGSSYFENETLINLNKQLKSYTLKTQNLEDNLEKLNIDIAKYQIESPIDGIINLNKSYSKGDYINAGTDIGTVIPKGEEAYKIQLFVPNKDISLVSVGDKVKFRLDALPYKEYGMLTGLVTMVSPDSSVDKTSGFSYYLVEASIENKPLVSYKGQESSIKVGMTLQGHVVTKRKKILYYLLEKIDLR
jgi:HlyD family secretion protein